MKNTIPVRPGSTIYDVAQTAEVSITTVSRYLNNPAKVNPDTGRRIQAAMDSLAYIPHGNTGAKVRRQVGRIGVLTPFFPAPSFVQRLQGMIPVFRQAGCEVLIYTVDSPEQLREYLQSIVFAKRLDGLVVLSMRLADDDVKKLAQSGLEVVLVEQHHPLFSGVEADNVAGGALAARHFLEKGYFPCGFLGENVQLPYSLHPSQRRWEGYSQTLAEGGQPVDPAHVRLGEGTVADARRLALDLLGSADRPRAVFAQSDLQAIGVLKAAQHLGLRVPQDLALIGFDDIEAADYLDLSTVSQALSESGKMAAELLVERIRFPGQPVRNLQLNVAVVPRATT